MLEREDYAEFLGPRAATNPKLVAIFDALDRTGTGSVECSDLTLALSIFCIGSKSMKLAFGFEILDDDRDEKLTARGVWRFIRSFLCVLLTLGNSFPNGMDYEEINRQLDSASVATASAILKHSKSERISFEAIADWYATEGCIKSSWIELLDTK